MGWGTRAEASAANIFITPTGAASGVCTTGVQTPTFFNTAGNWGAGATQIGPGTTVHLCGTFTSVVFTFQGNGASGNPVTLFFETGAIVQAPVCPFGTGCINGVGHSFFTIDGGGTGIVQNTGNGFGMANGASTKGLLLSGCTNCIVKNLIVRNMYVQVPPNHLPVDQNSINAIDIGGATNALVTKNSIFQCGWCIVEFFNSSNESGAEISFNDLHDFDHAWAIATGGTFTSTNPHFHDNQVHDAGTWDCGFDSGGNPNCHHDGIHAFGVNGSSIVGMLIYNNYFYGNWGATPTGFIFIEGGGSGSSNAHLSNAAGWNNVFVVPNGATINTNGWFSVFSGDSGFSQWYGNTVVGPNATDNTACTKMGSMNNLSYKNNVTSPCGGPIDMGSLTGFDGANVNFNFYGPSCQNGANCFVWNGAFRGSFGAWTGAGGCAGNGHSCDANSAQNNNPLLSATGVPQTGSPIIGTGTNLTALCTGSFISLCSGTSLGGTITPAARPASGNWDMGAYVSGSPIIVKPNPPTGVVATPN